MEYRWNVDTGFCNRLVLERMSVKLITSIVLLVVINITEVLGKKVTDID